MKLTKSVLGCHWFFKLSSFTDTNFILGEHSKNILVLLYQFRHDKFQVRSRSDLVPTSSVGFSFFNNVVFDVATTIVFWWLPVQSA